jgi:hypothetical protein
MIIIDGKAMARGMNALMEYKHEQDGKQHYEATETNNEGGAGVRRHGGAVAAEPATGAIGSAKSIYAGND